MTAKKRKRDARVVSVHLRLTAEEAEWFREAAKKVGRSLSGWLRWTAVRSL